MKDSRPIEISGATPLREALAVIDKRAMQIALVVDEDRRLLGTVTDGDVRRGILAGRELTDPVELIMNRRFASVTLEGGREEALGLMKTRRIHQVPVVDGDGRVVGIELLDELLAEAALDNQVVLLAGGKGTRLRPITESVPKPLVPVGGQPILERIVTSLAGHGFRHFWMAVNYKAEMIQEHFGDGSSRGLTIRYLVEDEPLGTAGALGLLPTRPSEPFLVMNADLLTAVNPRQLLDFHAAQGADATMCVREFDVQVPYGVVQMQGHRFVGVEEKPVQRYFVNAGIYVLSPSVLDLVEPGRPLNMTDLFEAVTAAGRPAAVFHVREYWMDIGRLQDLEQARVDVQGLFGEEP